MRQSAPNRVDMSQKEVTLYVTPFIAVCKGLQLKRSTSSCEGHGTLRSTAGRLRRSESVAASFR
jgi:hypothetical protein